MNLWKTYFMFSQWFHCQFEGGRLRSESLWCGRLEKRSQCLLGGPANSWTAQPVPLAKDLPSQYWWVSGWTSLMTLGFIYKMLNVNKICRLWDAVNSEEKWISFPFFFSARHNFCQASCCKIYLTAKTSCCFLPAACKLMLSIRHGRLGEQMRFVKKTNNACPRLNDAWEQDHQVMPVTK